MQPATMSVISTQKSSTRGWVLSVVCVILLAMGGFMTQRSTAAEAAKAKAWSGTWNNRKFNTTGALTCTVVGEQNGQWIAKFTGTGLGKPFTYTALISYKAASTNAMTLVGTNRVDGDTYTWSGSITGENMVGSFRSVTGNNGQFVLKEKK